MARLKRRNFGSAFFLHSTLFARRYGDCRAASRKCRKWSTAAAQRQLRTDRRMTNALQSRERMMYNSVRFPSIGPSLAIVGSRLLPTQGEHMIRSFVARASALLASATFAFLCIAPVAVPPAQGRTLNFPDACSLADNGSGNFTMTCGTTPPGALNCSIIGGPSGAVAAGAAISLTMSCSGGTTPYRYLWTPGGGSSGALATTVAATTTYSVTATDAAGATNTQSLTVTV